MNTIFVTPYFRPTLLNPGTHRKEHGREGEQFPANRNTTVFSYSFYL